MVTPSLVLLFVITCIVVIAIWRWLPGALARSSFTLGLSVASTVIGIALVLLTLLSGCDATAGDDEAGPDAGATLPLCEDVGCPTAAFCTADGCCTCNATGEPVRCLATPDATPDRCEP